VADSEPGERDAEREEQPERLPAPHTGIMPDGDRARTAVEAP
jgi:hypothetical protein